MKRKALILASAGFAFVLAGCQGYQHTTRIDTIVLPDQIYNVTVHETQRIYYAVLFDIPDDGMEVAMFYTYATHRIGRDTPAKYVDRFATRVKGYRTFQISDREGVVRGYLMISNLLGHLVYERPVGERLIVQISDPNLTKRF